MVLIKIQERNIQMRPAHNIGYLLNHVAFVLGRQSDQVLQERLGIGISQFKIMMTLQWTPHIQQKQIAERLGQTEASISRQMKLLEDAGLLNNTVNPANRREHVIRLTLKGERVTDEAVEILDQYHAPVFNTLDDKQKQYFSEMLQSMHRIVCGSDSPSSCHQMFEK